MVVAADDVSPWEDKAIRIRIGGIVRANLGMFAKYPDIGKADLFSALLIDVTSTLHTFKPGEGNRSLGGWVSMVAHRRLLNMLRDRARRATWDARYAQGQARCDVDEPPPEDPESESIEADALGSTNRGSLLEWCESTKATSRTLYGDRTIDVAGDVHRVEQLAPLALLQARLGVSSDSMFFVLSRRPDVCRAIGLEPPPDTDTIAAAGLLLEQARRDNGPVFKQHVRGYRRRNYSPASALNQN